MWELDPPESLSSTLVDNRFCSELEDSLYSSEPLRSRRHSSHSSKSQNQTWEEMKPNILTLSRNSRLLPLNSFMQSRPAVCRSCGCHKSLRVPFRLASTAKRTPRSHDSEKWVTVVGLEIHAQIKTNRKLFSRELHLPIFKVELRQS